MASWGRVAAVLRNVWRSPRSLKGLALRRAVGPGLLGSVIGAGAFCYYQYGANNTTLPFAVYAEVPKVSTEVDKPLQVSTVEPEHTDTRDDCSLHLNAGLKLRVKC